MKYKSVHCIGIGGCGLSGLAQFFAKKGAKVSGSDSTASSITNMLKASGIRIAIGHEDAHIPEKTDLVIHSLAIPHDNPELKIARKRGLKILTYPQAVGGLTPKFYTIAVCGTHGKSTVTAMIAKILIENNFDPSVLVGANLKELGNSNFRLGKSKILVLEACEYRRAFLEYSPHLIVLHTLDPDHLDYYKNFKDYLSAFRSFAGRLPNDGYFFANLDDEDVHDIASHMQRKKFPSYNLFTYASRYANATYYLKDRTIMRRGERVGDLDLKIPGAHNRSNALAAFSVASQFGIAAADILRSLNNYTGASRRFEFIGTLGQTQIIDDYGHHPAEISATLAAAREKYPKGRICVVFQPHQYSRTRQLLKEFGGTFKQADFVIIPDIYASRDTGKDIRAISPERLVAEIKRNHIRAVYGGGLEKTAGYLQKHSHEFDVIITMGAGDVWRVSRALASR